MNEAEFIKLCRDVSQALGRPDVEALGQQGRMEIDGIDIALFFEEKEMPDLLFCYVDMGPIPDASRLMAFEQLLVMNLLSGAKTNGVYTLDPASGHALFVVHFMHPEHMEAELLATAFRVYARQAAAFRKMLTDSAEPEDDSARMAHRSQFLNDLA